MDAWLHGDAGSAITAPVRIGLAHGPVVAYRGDYYGDVVNLAARLAKVAEPAQVLVSGPMADELSAVIALEAVRVPPLKGYERGVAAFRLPET